MGAAAIELTDCSFSYDGGLPALRGVTCSIEAGSWVALIGQNGSGKSTLAKLCNGLLRPQRGRVRVNGQDVGRRPVGEVAREVGYLFQNPDHQIFAPTVREEISFGVRNLGFADEEHERRLREALDAFGLTEYVERPPAVLGYGLRRLVTVASLFARRPPIMILDEATRGLDRGKIGLLLDRFGELQDGGHTILFITHDMRLVAERADQVIVLRRGELLAQGAVREILGRRELLERAAVSPPPITCLSQALRSAGMRGESLTVDEFHREYTALLQNGGGPR